MNKNLSLTSRICNCCSYDRGDTYNFHLGVGEVIRGMDMGMKGMCKGEKRKITIPPELGYGDDAVGNVRYTISCISWAMEMVQ